MYVVPYIGTWIETNTETARTGTEHVVPYIGTWIETLNLPPLEDMEASYLI